MVHPVINDQYEFFSRRLVLGLLLGFHSDLLRGLGGFGLGLDGLGLGLMIGRHVDLVSDLDGRGRGSVYELGLKKSISLSELVLSEHRSRPSAAVVNA